MVKSAQMRTPVTTRISPRAGQPAGAADLHACAVGCAFENALEVLAANGVDVLIAADGEYTPTPVVSHAILGYNRERQTGLADGVVITPSQNPPDNGDFKYNPGNGGPADTDVTGWIAQRGEAAFEGVGARHPAAFHGHGIDGQRESDDGDAGRRIGP